MTAGILDQNTLFYGDNLDILRNDIADESVDLIYLDPPFNSNATYNVIFTSPAGEKSQAQVQAFKDSWNWEIDGAERAYDDILRSSYTNASELIVALRKVLGENDLMAYLTMMAVRLIELHRVLKSTGSLYLHCDPTASHYLKILLDAVFGAKQFRNEITWKRSAAHSDGSRFGRNTDSILFFTKSKPWTWHPVFTRYDDTYKERFRFSDPDGRKWMDDNLTAKGLTGGGYTYEYNGVTSYWRLPFASMERLDAEGRLHFTNRGGVRLKRYLDEAKGLPAQALWDDIPPINSQAQERLGYPTQKPVALLERILSASTNEGDLVLDPFCGCGTTVHAAEKLGRRWIGIDITHLAVRLIEKRLHNAFAEIAFTVTGAPEDLDGAHALAKADKHEFQLWALSLVEAQPFKGGIKGADGGIDGLIWFYPGKNTTEKAVVSVKGGKNVSDTQVKDLLATVEHTGAKMGLFVTLTPPTKPMLARAASAGFYRTEFGEYPKIQILTIEELLDEAQPKMPWRNETAFRTAKRETAINQSEMDV